MMIIMRVDASQKEINDVVLRVEKDGLKPHISKGEERTVIGVMGDQRKISHSSFIHLPGVDRIVPISRPYKLASREFNPKDTAFQIDNLKIGGNDIFIIAGPCAVESRSQLLETEIGRAHV